MEFIKEIWARMTSWKSTTFGFVLGGSLLLTIIFPAFIVTIIQAVVIGAALYFFLKRD